MRGVPNQPSDRGHTRFPVLRIRVKLGSDQGTTHQRRLDKHRDSKSGWLQHLHSRGVPVHFRAPSTAAHPDPRPLNSEAPDNLVQRRPADLLPPLDRPLLQPIDRRARITAFHNIEHLAGSDVNDLLQRRPCRPGTTHAPAESAEWLKATPDRPRRASWQIAPTTTTSDPATR